MGGPSRIWMVPHPVCPLHRQRAPGENRLTRFVFCRFQSLDRTIGTFQGVGENLSLDRSSGVVLRRTGSARGALAAHLAALLVGNIPRLVAIGPDSPHDLAQFLPTERAQAWMVSLFHRIVFGFRQHLFLDGSWHAHMILPDAGYGRPQPSTGGPCSFFRPISCGPGHPACIRGSRRVWRRGL